MNTYRRINTSEEVLNILEDVLEAYDKEYTKKQVTTRTYRNGWHAVNYAVPIDIGDAVITVVNGTEPGVALRLVVGLKQGDRVMIFKKGFLHDRIIHRVGDKVEDYLSQLDVIANDVIEFIDNGGVSRYIQEFQKIWLDSPIIYRLLDEDTNPLRLPKKVIRGVKKKMGFQSVCTVWRLYELISEELRHRTRSGKRFFDLNYGLVEKIVELTAA